MTHRVLLPALLAALLLSAPAARADSGVPLLVTVQGRLLDASDQPVNGAVSLRYALYAEGDDLPNRPPAEPLWQATYEVQAFNGVFAVHLGDVSKGQPALPATFFDGSVPRWMGVSVNGASEMRPRLSITSTPFALVAGRALDAQLLGGKAPATYHDASLLTGVAPASVLGTGSSALTTLGTVTSGEWTATPLADAYVASAGTWNAKLAAVAHDGTLGGDGTTASPLSVNAQALGMLPLSGGVITGDLAVQGSLKVQTGTTAGTLAAGDDVRFGRWSGGAAGLDAALGRASLGLGSAATANTSAFATAAQGAKADAALPAAGGAIGGNLDVAGTLKVGGVLDAPNNLELVPVADARLAYFPNDFSCTSGKWCNQADAWGSNRFSQNARYTFCEGEADCGGASVELKLDANKYRSVLLSHLDWSNTRQLAVFLSFDGGQTYAFHKTIDTFRASTGTPYTSSIRTIASNLPLGGNVRVKVVAARGRMHFEGFGLSKMTLPETDVPPPSVWRLAVQEHPSTTGAASGWSNNTVTVCGTSNIIGGYNTFAGGSVVKTYANLPPHTTVRVVLDYYFIDTWDGENGYVQVDGATQWQMPRSNCCSGGPNICGNASYPDAIVPVEFELPHSSPTLRLGVGSTLDQAASDESFGFSNVRIYVR